MIANTAVCSRPSPRPTIASAMETAEYDTAPKSRADPESARPSTRRPGWTRFVPPCGRPQDLARSPPPRKVRRGSTAMRARRERLHVPGWPPDPEGVGPTADEYSNCTGWGHPCSRRDPHGVRTTDRRHHAGNTYPVPVGRRNTMPCTGGMIRCIRLVCGWLVSTAGCPPPRTELQRRTYANHPSDETLTASAASRGSTAGTSLSATMTVR